MIEGGDDFVQERNVEFLVKVEYALHLLVIERARKLLECVMCEWTRGLSGIAKLCYQA